MKIARLLIYEGTADKLQKQLGRSLADGKKKFREIELSTITIGITEGLNRFVEAQFDPVEKKHCQPDLSAMKSNVMIMMGQIAELRDEGYKVSWAYQRKTRLNAIGLSSREFEGEVSETFCSIFGDCSNDFTGSAKKHPKDTSNLKIARLVSFNRAYYQYLERKL